MGIGGMAPATSEERRAVHEVVEAAVRHASEVAHAASKEWYDRDKEDVVFAPGQHVLVWSPTRDRKLAPHWKGPMEVIGMDSKLVAKGKDQVTGREMLRHVSYLRAYDGTRTSPAMAIGYELPAGYFMVEKVVAHRDKPRREVLIHWANTEPEEDTWEPLGSDDMRDNGVVKAYCAEHGVRIPARRRRDVDDEDE